MNRYPRHEISPPSESPSENLNATPRLLRRWGGRRRARRLELARQVADQNLAWRVQEILVGCGLIQAGFSLAAGRTFYIPRVVSVVREPKVRLSIHMLPGQMPDDFAAHARRIAYNLDVADVQVVPLEPGLIRMELVPKPDSARASVNGWQGRPPQYQ